MNPLHEPDHHALQGEQVSALCDGALSAQEFDELLAHCRDDDGVPARWHGYQLIGEVLRGQPSVLPACSPSAFLDRLHAGLKSETPAPRAPLVSPMPQVRGAAANDAVFRWKLVSGLASVVAVAAIGWNLLVVTEPAARGAAELAQSVPAAAVVPVAAAVPAAAVPAAESRPVVVSTPQGQVIRDAALERLLAEHRQHGGMSAFQTSTGFIRNATYDADAR
ncbi:MAG: sigma-E factor negative regulatory protein [Hydrogenophaga sp.]|nr:sigma-E factor negative regulatory protein [Hydrogenophaga sp.]